MIRLSVATNFDDDLPELIKPYGATELFGKLTRDAAGGGRASFTLPRMSRRRLAEHVRHTHKSGLQFNYLINSACMGNREFSRSGQKVLRGLLDWLSEIEVDGLTVSIPYIVELVKSRYPHFKVKIGVFAEVDTPKKSKFFEELGADCITLQPLIVNRDFQRLRAIRDAVKCELQLVANSNCLLECPMTPYHNVGLSHASQKGSSGFFIDYCLIRCLVEKLVEPVNYIKSPWIRPEDLHHYEALNYNSFKILERGAPTATMLRRVRAYHGRRFDGNLIGLVQCYGFADKPSKKQPMRRWLWEVWEMFKPWKVDPLRLLPLKRLANLQGMIYAPSGGQDMFSVDNRALDGFVDRFVQENCINLDCDRCLYCHEYARRAVHIDENYRRECLMLAQQLLEDLKSGRMWWRLHDSGGRPT